MSIWCSWPGIGWDTWRKRGKFKRGEVRTYAAGFSNHYPESTGSHELPARVGIDHIAPWCVPGHEEGDSCPGGHDWPQVGPWLRLCVSADDSLTWWVDRGDDKPQYTGPISAMVVMDEAVIPCANAGGVLARHIPEIDWKAVWLSIDPNWTPPPEGEPEAVTVYPKLRLVLTEDRA